MQLRRPMVPSALPCAPCAAPVATEAIAAAPLQRQRRAERAVADPYAVSLASGAVAGMTVEALLFPLDCLKTRAQSSRCEALRATRFPARGLYRGLGTAVASSAPASAAFFSVYELAKHALEAHLAPNGEALSRTGHCGVAVLASVTAELVAYGALPTL